MYVIQEGLLMISKAFGNIVSQMADVFPKRFGIADAQGLILASNGPEVSEDIDGLTANDLWEDTLSGETYFEIIKKQIDGCSKAEIPIGVMHVSCDSKGPEPGKIGIDRFKKLCDYSEKKKVNHGFCWDCGHNLCYKGPLTMELPYKYKNMPLESFFKTAFERIQKIKAFTE